jgi:putative membrane protein insertion efficiency factor
VKRSLATFVTLPPRALRALILAPIVAYQRFVSPAFPRRCKYYPTCSEYAVNAIREVGVVRGTILAAWRLVRCNPFSHGGVDLLEDRPFFRESIPLESSAPARPHSHDRSSCGLAPASGSSGSAEGARQGRPSAA